MLWRCGPWSRFLFFTAAAIVNLDAIPHAGAVAVAAPRREPAVELRRGGQAPAAAAGRLYQSAEVRRTAQY